MELKEVASEDPPFKDQNDVANTKNNATDYLQNDKGGIHCARNANICSIYANKIETFFKVNARKLTIIRNCLLLAGYLVYFVFAVLYHVGDEGSWRLIGCTAFGLLLLTWNVLKKNGYTRCVTSSCSRLSQGYSRGRTSTIIRWSLYLVTSVLMVLYVVFAVAMKTPENLRSIMGIFGLPFLLFLYSNNKRKVNWHTVYWGMALQFIMALMILKTNWGAAIIRWVGDRLTELISNAEAGSEFIFGKKWVDHPFAFGSMVQVIVLVVTISVLTYLGVIKFVVETLGRVLALCLQTSPAEGINAIANMFLHVPESALIIQEYLPTMLPSQLFVTCAGALSTVGGVSLIIFMASGVPAAPLVAASAMSAPAALSAAKLVFPTHEDEELPKPPEEDGQQKSSLLMRRPKSLMDSIVVGINQGKALVMQAVMFIMTFVIILEVINNTLTWFGVRVGVDDVTVQYIFSYIFYPCAFLMGARHEDCLFIGELLGIRTFSLAVVAYPVLGPIVVNGREFRSYIAESPNNTWTQVNKDVFLDNWNKTLVGGVIEPRSEVIATYALCGSASFAIMGLILGSYSILVPHRMEEVTRHVFRAMVAGTVASYLTASFAGLLFEEGVGGY